MGKQGRLNVSQRKTKSGHLREEEHLFKPVLLESLIAIRVVITHRFFIPVTFSSLGQIIGKKRKGNECLSTILIIQQFFRLILKGKWGNERAINFNEGEERGGGGGGGVSAIKSSACFTCCLIFISMKVFLHIHRTFIHYICVCFLNLTFRYLYNICAN